MSVQAAMLPTARVSKLRTFYLPIAVLIGIALSVLVFQTLNPGPIDSFVLNGTFLKSAFLQHVVLSVTSFGFVLVLGVPLGVLIAIGGRVPRIVVFVLANVGQAVPGIGILALLTVWLGLGAVPTVIALVIYGMLPVLRNTVAGIQGVDPGAVEAARGMGMTRWQALTRVQIPLAAPLIFAGLRTTLVLIVGTATLGNFIGGGGLGNVINSGITRSDRIVFVGAVMVAALALLADWVLSLVENVLVPKRISTSAKEAT
ncbi:MAG: ABC transporter permease [Candidatus Dormibacteraeota bacterium]|nr:ABC transporter permease [Candidatus Dormibacteraeota bacterium]